MPKIRKTTVIAASLVLVTGSALAISSGMNGSKRGNLSVFAAASLTKVLPELATAFQAKNPKVAFTYSFAGSSTLAEQINAGAPADLFFSAGPAPMATVRNDGQIDGAAQNFSSNSLVIAVAPGNPLRISTLADLAKPGIKFLLCAPQVPCGDASAKVLAAAKVMAKPVSLENDVKSVLNKVILGEADAGLVYRTDITNQVTAVDFAESRAVTNEYSMATIKGSRAASTAHAFMDFVLSGAGQTILSKVGFGKP